MDKLSEWLSGMEYQLLQGGPEQPVSEVVYDSRKAAPNTVFVCMTGTRTDSHNFIPEVYEKGCRAFVVEKDRQQLMEENPEAAAVLFGKAQKEPEGKQEEDFGKQPAVIRVENARHALALLSAARFSFPARRMTMIGITGTKGKTTTAALLKSILEHCGKKVGLIGTNGCEIAGVHYNTNNTTPESYELHQRFAQMLEAGCEYAVIECSSQGFKMHRTDGILFDYGLFLNISPDHIGPLEHKDFSEYLSCKAKLFTQSKTGVINLDDPHAREIMAGASCRFYTYGMNPPADLWAKEPEYLAEKDFFGIRFQTEGLLSGAYRLSLPGEYNISNALAALLVSSLLQLPDSKVAEALSQIRVKGRMEIVYQSEKFKMLVDYAHNEASMENLLKALRHYKPGRLVVVFGCGGNRSVERRTGMGAAAAQLADHTILTADNSRFERTEDIIADIRKAYLAAGGSQEALQEIPDRREAIRYAAAHAEPGDLIAVIGKGHEDYQEAEGKRAHFSDREEILEAVKLLEK